MSLGVRALLVGAFALVALTLAGAGATPAAADVRVSEAAGGRITVEAHGATVRQILDAVGAALGAARPLRLRTSDALTRTVTGTYSGSLPHVLSRILDGYNHVIHMTAAGVELEVLGTAPGVHATASVVGTVTLMPNGTHRVSANLDADDEAAAAGPPRAVTVNAPTPAIPPAAPVMPSAAPADVTGSVQPPGTPRVSSNVDLDEERR